MTGLYSSPLNALPQTNVGAIGVPLGANPDSNVLIRNLQWSTPATGQMTVSFDVVDSSLQPLVADSLTLEWGYDATYSETPVNQAGASTFSTTLTVNSAEDVGVYLKATASTSLGDPSPVYGFGWTLDQTTPAILSVVFSWTRAGGSLADLEVLVTMNGANGSSYCSGLLDYNGLKVWSQEQYGASPHILRYTGIPSNTAVSVEIEVYDRSGNTNGGVPYGSTSPNYSPPQVLSYSTSVSDTNVTYNVEVDKDCNLIIGEYVGAQQEDLFGVAILAGAVRAIASTVDLPGTNYTYTLEPRHPEDGIGAQVSGVFMTDPVATPPVWVTRPVYQISQPVASDGIADIAMLSAEVSQPPTEDWEIRYEFGSWQPLVGTSGETTITGRSLVTSIPATEAELGEFWTIEVRVTKDADVIFDTQNLPAVDYKDPVSTPGTISIFLDQTGPGVGAIKFAAHTWDEPVNLVSRVNGSAFAGHGSSDTFAETVIAADVSATGSETYTVDLWGSDAAGNRNEQQEVINAPNWAPPVVLSHSATTSGLDVEYTIEVDKDCTVRIVEQVRGGAVEDTTDYPITAGAPRTIDSQSQLFDTLYDYTITPIHPQDGTGSTVNGSYTTDSSGFSWSQLPVWSVAKASNGVANISLTTASVTQATDKDWEYQIDGGGWLGIASTLGEVTISVADLITGEASTEAGGSWILELRASLGVETVSNSQTIAKPDYKDPVSTPDPVDMYIEQTGSAQGRIMFEAHTWDEVVTLRSRIDGGGWNTHGTTNSFSVSPIATALSATGVETYNVDLEGADAAGNTKLMQEAISAPNWSPPVILSHSATTNGLDVEYTVEVDKDCTLRIEERIQGGAVEDTTDYPITAGAPRTINSQSQLFDTTYDYTMTPIHATDGTGTPVNGTYTTDSSGFAWVQLPIWNPQKSSDGVANIDLTTATVSIAPDVNWDYQIDSGGWTAIPGTSGQTTISVTDLITGEAATEAGGSWTLELRTGLAAETLTNSQVIAKPDYKAPVSTPATVSIYMEQTGSAEGRIMFGAHTWDESTTVRTRVDGGAWFGHGTNTSFPISAIATALSATGVESYTVDLEGTDASGNVIPQQEVIAAPNWAPPVVLSHNATTNGLDVEYTIEVDKDCTLTIVEQIQGGAVEDSTDYPITAGAPRTINSQSIQYDTIYDYFITPTHPQDGTGTTVQGTYTTDSSGFAWVTLPVWTSTRQSNNVAVFGVTTAEVNLAPDQDWEYQIDGKGWNSITSTLGEVSLTDQPVGSDTPSSENEVGQNWSLGLRATLGVDVVTNTQDVPKQDFKDPVPSFTTDVWIFEQTGVGVGRIVLEAHDWDETVTLQTQVDGGSVGNQGVNTSFARTILASDLAMTGSEQYQVDITGIDAAGNTHLDSQTKTAPDFGILPTNTAPVWLTTAFTGTLTNGTPFSEDISGYAADPEGDTVTYTVTDAAGTDASMTGTTFTVNNHAADTWYTFEVTAADNGIPPLSETNSFVIYSESSGGGGPATEDLWTLVPLTWESAPDQSTIWAQQAGIIFEVAEACELQLVRIRLNQAAGGANLSIQIWEDGVLATTLPTGETTIVGVRDYELSGIDYSLSIGTTYAVCAVTDNATTGRTRWHRKTDSSFLSPNSYGTFFRNVKACAQDTAITDPPVEVTIARIYWMTAEISGPGGGPGPGPGTPSRLWDEATLTWSDPPDNNTGCRGAGVDFTLASNGKLTECRVKLALTNAAHVGRAVNLQIWQASSILTTIPIAVTTQQGELDYENTSLDYDLTAGLAYRLQVIVGDVVDDTRYQIRRKNSSAFEGSTYGNYQSVQATHQDIAPDNEPVNAPANRLCYVDVVVNF